MLKIFYSDRIRLDDIGYYFYCSTKTQIWKGKTDPKFRLPDKAFSKLIWTSWSSKCIGWWQNTQLCPFGTSFDARCRRYISYCGCKGSGETFVRLEAANPEAPEVRSRSPLSTFATLPNFYTTICLVQDLFLNLPVRPELPDSWSS